MHKRWFSLGAVLVFSMLIALASIGTLYAAPPRRDCTAVAVYITSPTSETTVSGVTSIVGSAWLPNNEFRYYKVEYAAAGSNGWTPFVSGVRTPVRDGLLATVDTRVLPAGDYSFRVLAVDYTGNYCEGDVTPIHVSSDPNAVGTPTPTGTIFPTPLPHTQSTVAPGTPTLVVDLNANTPNSDSLLNGGSSAGKSLLPQLPFDVNSLGAQASGLAGDAQHSFVWGMQLTGGLFLLLGVVVFLRRNL